MADTLTMSGQELIRKVLRRPGDPMARPPLKPLEKLRIVLVLMRGEVSIKEAARREGASEPESVE